MEQYQFIDNKGTFTLENPELTSYLYFPIVNEAGMMSSVTPSFGGDAKTGQNTFLLEPVSSENLHNNKSTRNFWLRLEGKERGKNIWSATGVSAGQQSRIFCEDKEETKLEAGLLYQKMTRTSAAFGLRSEVTIFAPVTEDQVELMRVMVENIGEEEICLTPVAAIPLFARSADHIREHRNATSMLHRIFTMKEGIAVIPTLTFDERGGQRNRMAYGIFGRGNGGSPVGFYPVTEDFIGEGGSFENPYAVVSEEVPVVKAGTQIDGYEAMGALVFKKITLQPGESASYVTVLGARESVQEGKKTAGSKEPKEPEGSEETAAMAEMLFDMASSYLDEKAFDERLRENKAYWNRKNNIFFQSADKRFDEWMYWVSFQPMLRRIYGDSFLPHHDHGRGGRGWRDLWQECLPLLLMNPDGVREILLDNFCGVRVDGTNVTDIEKETGEFTADGNEGARIWMDHGMWPYLVTELYLKQSGDLGILLEEAPYFKDSQACRGAEYDPEWEEDQGNIQRTVTGRIYKGTVLEHLILQHLTAFYDVGEHNHIRLRGADWNDAVDMAKERGESVAFTTIYGGNLTGIARMLRKLKEVMGVREIRLAEEMLPFFWDGDALYNDISAKQELLRQYCRQCAHSLSGKKRKYEIQTIAANLEGKAEWIRRHVRNAEWTGDGEGRHWFNSYYDNSGRQVEGKHESGVRMMLAGQVFSIMSDTATDDQVEEIIRAADTYLYDASVGGYRQNTDFHEVKTDLGRMFGFGYGQKENGAVLCQMAVLYANALYRRGFVKEGYKAVHSLYSHICDVKKSKIYPGVPEYFDPKGRGVCHYLTDAAALLVLTVQTEMFGVKGRWGDLLLEPKLLQEQFDDQGRASVEAVFRGKKVRVIYENQSGKEYGGYQIGEVMLNGAKVPEDACGQTEALIRKDLIDSCSADVIQQIVVKLI